MRGGQILKIEIDIDEQTYETIQKMAQEQCTSVDRVIAHLVTGAPGTPVEPQGILGLFASEADLIDEVCEAAMTARSRHPLRNA
jgi:hypothetical protein